MKSNRKRTASASRRRTSTATSRKRTGSTRTNVRSNSIVSLETGIKVLRTAIKREISVSKAAKNVHKLGRNFVSDIKARLEDNYKNKNITTELYRTFKSLNKQYEKVVG